MARRNVYTCDHPACATSLELPELASPDHHGWGDVALEIGHVGWHRRKRTMQLCPDCFTTLREHLCLNEALRDQDVR